MVLAGAFSLGISPEAVTVGCLASAEDQGCVLFFFFFLKDTAPTEISPLPLHDALPISRPFHQSVQAHELTVQAAQILPSGRRRPAGGRSGCSREGGGRGGGGGRARLERGRPGVERDRKSTRLNSSHGYISYAVFCLKKK